MKRNYSYYFNDTNLNKPDYTFQESYKNAFIIQKEILEQWRELYNQQKQKLIDLQEYYVKLYKTKIVRKYMSLWNNNSYQLGIVDIELLNVIYNLAGLKFPDYDKPVKVKTHIDQISNLIKIEYFHNKLDKWIELRP